ncbi:MAG: GNAT family N-acetyltransferase [Chitinophagaceae bacterium]|nr:MAG: GNAT family N-acetyltransferase [Chitinophagaceae bacterium]
MNNYNIEIKEIFGLEEMKKLFLLIQQLNSDLKEQEYIDMLKDMLPKGYRQVGAFVDGICVGVAGFWINTKLYCGKYIEPDNVIVSDTHRNLKLGTKLLDWLHTEAIAQNCNVSLLDAYVQNKDAHRFYFREGYSILGFHMIKKLK